jgi:hypothetical protein
LSKIAFFDSRGMQKTNYIACRVPLNADYIFGVLKKFMKAICLKRPDMVSGEYMFHWDNASVHTAQIVLPLLAKKNFPNSSSLLT